MRFYLFLVTFIIRTDYSKFFNYSQVKCVRFNSRERSEENFDFKHSDKKHSIKNYTTLLPMSMFQDVYRFFFSQGIIVKIFKI